MVIPSQIGSLRSMSAVGSGVHAPLSINSTWVPFGHVIEKLKSPMKLCSKLTANPVPICARVESVSSSIAPPQALHSAQYRYLECPKGCRVIHTHVAVVIARTDDHWVGGVIAVVLTASEYVQLPHS